MPCGKEQGLQTAAPELSLMVSDEAVPFVTCHDRVAACPGGIVLGLAVNVKTIGTVTVAVCGPTLPPGPLAVIENIVVPVTGTTAVPEVGSGPESSLTAIAGLIVTLVALLVAQVSVIVCPLFTTLGLTLNCVIVGGTGCAT